MADRSWCINIPAPSPPHLSGLTLGCVFDKDLQSFPSEIKKQSLSLVTFIGCLHFPVLLPLHPPTHLPDKLLALKFCVKVCFGGNPNSETCLPNSYLPLIPQPNLNVCDNLLFQILGEHVHLEKPHPLLQQINLWENLVLTFQ